MITKLSLLLLISFIPLSLNGKATGRLIFSSIKPLEHGWDANTYHLWGANLRNYRNRNPQRLLGGGGMASKKGPTSGRGHPNYIGVITVTLNPKENDLVFAELVERLKNGSDVVVPIFYGRFSLGSGIAKRKFKERINWYKSQQYLLSKILELSEISNQTIIPEGTYWSDFDSKHLIKNESDIKLIVKNLLNRL